MADVAVSRTSETNSGDGNSIAIVSVVSRSDGEAVIGHRSAESDGSLVAVSSESVS